MSAKWGNRFNEKCVIFRVAKLKIDEQNGNNFNTQKNLRVGKDETYTPKIRAGIKNISWNMWYVSTTQIS